ncbi:MAG: response regulator, partial [Bacteroidia bacterium]|nr:response regulator [Bacteroidia bacterium]
DALFTDKKILVVDDDMRNVFALSKILTNKGMKVSKAVNGKMAMEVIEKEGDFDLVLLDIMMPEMDGYETTRRLRENPRFRNLPIIALTAKAMKDDRQKCIDAGANDYLSKPVNVDKLLSLMRVWLYR